MGRGLLVAAIVATTLDCAAAQSGTAPQPQCRELLTLREELQRQRQAIEVASKSKADAKAGCQLFRNYIVTEARMLRELDAHGTSCGMSVQFSQQVRANHATLTQVAKQVCDRAQRGREIDEEVLRQFRLHPEPQPKPWPAGARLADACRSAA